jgi:hypothetical protein
VGSGYVKGNDNMKRGTDPIPGGEFPEGRGLMKTRDWMLGVRSINRLNEGPYILYRPEECL